MEIRRGMITTVVCRLLSFVEVLLPKASLSLTFPTLCHTLSVLPSLIFAFSLWHILFPFYGILFPWFGFLVNLYSSLKTPLKCYLLWLPSPRAPGGIKDSHFGAAMIAWTLSLTLG